MEHVYALGVSCIESIQYWFAGWSGYFELVNHFANPHYVMEILFPLLSIVDSVFASQLLLCMAFGGWLNGVMKWWLLEDRPYWWVRETTFYTNSHRPHLQQTTQSCETGPGSPSGHSVTAASVLILAVMWSSHVFNDRSESYWWVLETTCCTNSLCPHLQQSTQSCETGPGSPSGYSVTTASVLILAVMWSSHVFNDRKWDVRWWKAVVYPLFGAALGSVMLARMFVATHFPHQCLLGSLIGVFMAPALCIYVTDPFIWRYSTHSTMPVRQAVLWHAVCAGIAIVITVLTYWSLRLCGIDPDFTVRLAYRWCTNPDHIHVSTTPVYALVQCTAGLLGWALTVTPAVAQYRHYTKNRSLLISIVATGVSIYLLKRLDASITNTSDVYYYALQFILNVIKPALLLRVVPTLAMWPYYSENKQKIQ